MASTENNLNEFHVLQALKIEGNTTAEAREIIELAKQVSELGPKQQLLRARDLDENHIGMQIDCLGHTGILDDIELQRRNGRMAGNPKKLYHTMADTDPCEDNGPYSVSRVANVTTVINSKIVRLPVSRLVKLTETRDL